MVLKYQATLLGDVLSLGWFWTKALKKKKVYFRTIKLTLFSACLSTFDFVEI